MFGFVNVYVFNNLGDGAIRADIVLDEEDPCDNFNTQAFRQSG